MVASEVFRVRFCRGSRSVKATLRLSGSDIGGPDGFKREAQEVLAPLGVTVTLRPVVETKGEGYCVDDLWTSARALLGAAIGEFRESPEGGLD